MMGSRRANSSWKAWLPICASFARARIAHTGRHRRHVGQAFGQRLEIQTRAAGEDGNAARRAHLVQRMARIALVAPGRIGLVRRHVAVEQMRHARHVGIGRTRRQDARLAVDLHGIGVHDHAAQRARQFQRGVRLAARGGACDKNGIDGQGATLLSDTSEMARFEALAEEP